MSGLESTDSTPGVPCTRFPQRYLRGLGVLLALRILKTGNAIYALRPILWRSIAC